MTPERGSGVHDGGSDAWYSNERQTVERQTVAEAGRGPGAGVSEPVFGPAAAPGDPRGTSPAPPPAAVPAGPAVTPLAYAPAGESSADWMVARRISPWGIVRRNLSLLVAVLAVSIGAAIVATLLTTPQFAGTASIQVEPTPPRLPVIDVPIARTPTGFGTTPVQNDLEVLGSRTIAAAVIDTLGLRVRLASPRRTVRRRVLAAVGSMRDGGATTLRIARGADGRLTLTTRSDDERFSGDRPVAVGDTVRVPGAWFVIAPGARALERIDLEVRPFDATLEEFRKSIKIARPNREADVVAVTYTSTDPELARDVPNAVVAVFMARRQNGQRYQAHQTARFLRIQLDAIAAELRAAEDSLRAYRESARVVDLAEQARHEVGAVAEMQARRTALDVERSALAKLLTEAERPRRDGDVPSPYRNLVAFPALLGNQAMAGMLQSLVAVDDRRAELLTRRRPSDPDVEALTARVRQIEEQLHDLATTYLTGMTNQLSTMDGNLASSSRRLEQLPQQQVELARLERRAKILGTVYEPLQTRLKQEEITAALDDPSIRLIDAAVVPHKPVRPKPLMNIGLSAFAALLLGALIAFLTERADRSLHTRHEVEITTGLPILGLIPHIRLTPPPRHRRVEGGGGEWSLRRLHLGGRGRGRRHDPHDDLLTHRGGRRGDAAGTSAPLGARRPTLTGVSARSPVAEAYNRLQANLAFVRAATPLRHIVVTSPLAGDGKTTVSVNLALTLMMRGQRVLLVDADMRRGTIARLFGLAARPGLAEVLAHGASLREVTQAVELGAGTRLDVLAAGAPPANPAHLLGDARARELLAQLAERYDTVVLDTPPLNAVADALLLGAAVDGMLVVARSGVTTVDALAFAMEQLRTAPVPLVGAVLNDIDLERDAVYDASYRYAGYGATYYAAAH